MKIVGAASEKLQDYCPNFISGQAVEDLEVFVLFLLSLIYNNHAKLLPSAHHLLRGGMGKQ